MKFLIAVLTVLAASAASAGIQGDKIYFQKDSTWVSAAYNKTLCYDSNKQQFEAQVTKCVKEYSGDNGGCAQWAKFPATQPALTTAKRCVEGSERCTKWESYTYVQSPVVTYQITEGEHDRVVATKTVRVPSCGTNVMN